MRIDKVSKLDKTVVATGIYNNRPYKAEITIAAIPTKNMSKLVVVVGTDARPASQRDIQDVHLSLKPALVFFPTVDVDVYSDDVREMSETINYKATNLIDVQDDVIQMRNQHPDDFLFIMIGHEDKPPSLSDLLNVHNKLSSVFPLKAVVTHGMIELYVYL